MTLKEKQEFAGRLFAAGQRAEALTLAEARLSEEETAEIWKEWAEALVSLGKATPKPEASAPPLPLAKKAPGS
jgi:hypothetical protein